MNAVTYRTLEARDNEPSPFLLLNRPSTTAPGHVTQTLTSTCSIYVVPGWWQSRRLPRCHNWKTCSCCEAELKWGVHCQPKPAKGNCDDRKTIMSDWLRHSDGQYKLLLTSHRYAFFCSSGTRHQLVQWLGLHTSDCMNHTTKFSDKCVYSHYEKILETMGGARIHSTWFYKIKQLCTRLFIAENIWHTL